MQEPEKQIGFRGTKEYRERLQREALDRGLKVQGLIEIALAEYLKSEPAKEINRTIAKPEDVRLNTLFQKVSRHLSSRDRETLIRLLEILELNQNVGYTTTGESVSEGRNANSEPTGETDTAGKAEGYGKGHAGTHQKH